MSDQGFKTRTGARTVDSHQHFWDLSRLTYDWMSSDQKPLLRNYTPPDLRPILDSAGIERTVVVQAHSSVDEARWLLGLADQHPWIAGVVAWVDLTSPALADTLDELQANKKLVGIRHLVHDESDNRWLARPDVLSGLGELEKRGIRYDLLFRPQHIPIARVVYEARPGLRMLVDHIAKPFIKEGQVEPWASGMKDIAKIPGLYCKLSGMITEANHTGWHPDDLLPYVSRMVEYFGEDRLLFGSDWPVCTLAGSYGQVADALDYCLDRIGVGQAGRQKIFGQNAIDFYGLEP